MIDDESPMPYEGLQVLDISQGIAGPYCAQIMWQQGADVIKVEPPSGDWGRAVGVVRGDNSALSLQFNAGKRGLALDTRTDAGRRVLLELASRADVVIQNFRPGVVQRMGVSYGDVTTRNPNVVYVSISGYGPSGPSADAPATDSVMQADSGLMFGNQDEHGHPRRVGVLMVDIGTGLYAAQSLATALYHRLAHKEGSHIQVSLFEACAAFQGMNFLEQAMAGARPFGAVSAPNGVFHTSDGRLTIVVLNNDQFVRLCRALDRGAWTEEPRFADNAARMRHKDELHAEIGAQLHRHSTDYWMQRFSQHDVLHAPVRDYVGVINHPQAKHLEMFQQLVQPGQGIMPYMGLPARIHRRAVKPAPTIGQHSRQILFEAGLGADRIQKLISGDVVYQAPETDGV